MKQNTKEMYSRLLGTDSDDLVSGSTLKLDYLLTHYQDVPPSEDIDRFVRAYILFVIGTILLPMKDDMVLCHLCIESVRGYHQDKRLCLGAAMLAHSIREFWYMKTCRGRRVTATKSFAANAIFHQVNFLLF